MKKIVILSVLVLTLHHVATAQFVHYGARVAAGPTYVTDDLLTSSPIFGATVGGYVDYMFTEWKNPWSENIYLQTGLNLTRRGTNLRQVWVREPRSVRQSYYHNYYVQIPIIAGFKYELPQLPAGNYINFFFGPTVNVGIWGRLWDRWVTPSAPHISHNYDSFVTGTKDDRSSFKHIRRLDVGVILGFGYQWQNFTFDFYLDHGFIALMKKADVLTPFDTAPQIDEDGNEYTPDAVDRNAYTGTNQTFMLSIGYQLPINR